MQIFSLVSLFLTLVPTVLTKLGYVSPDIEQALIRLGLALPQVIKQLAADPNTSQTQRILTILQEIQTGISSLALSEENENLALVQSTSASLAAAIEGYKEAGQVTDPSKLTPLPTNL